MTNVDLDVRRMRREEILHRLRLAVNSMLKGCRICNRSATSEAAMVEHVRGSRHRDIIDSRAYRRTMLETTGFYDDSKWCKICGKESPNLEAFEDHLRGAGHREAVNVENALWMNRLAIKLLCEELLRRGDVIPSWCPRMFQSPVEDVDESAGAASSGTGLKRPAVPLVRATVAEAGCARSSGAARGAVAVGAAQRQGTPPPVRQATELCAPALAQPAEDTVGKGDDEDYSIPIDRKLGWITSGVQGLAAISSGNSDDLGLIRNKVDELEIVMRKLGARDEQMFSTIDTLSAGMQSMAEQNRTLEAKVLGAMKMLSDKLEGLVDRPSGGVLGLPLTATVVLSEVRRA